MINLTQGAAHLLIGAIRVRHYQLDRSPTPSEIADLLDRSETEIRLELVFLQKIGVVALVDSAFMTHVEVSDPRRVEQLPEQEGPALRDDLEDFDRRREAEAERLSRLFDTGESAGENRQAMDRMDEEFTRFHRKKPRDPFAAD